MPYTKLRFHIILPTKHRCPWITGPLERRLYAEIQRLVKTLGGHLIAIGGIADHIHIVVALPASQSVSAFVGKLKCNASREIRLAFPRADFRWSRGYGAFTVSPFEMQEVVEYVLRQKEHHGCEGVREEFERTEA